jgi:hypothetical protein
VRLEFPVGRIVYQPHGGRAMSDFRREETCLPSTTMSRRETTAESSLLTAKETTRSPPVSSQPRKASPGRAMERRFGLQPLAKAQRAPYTRWISLDKERLVLRVPGTLTLQDITPDGRVLLTVDNDQIGVLGARSGKPAREISLGLTGH